MDKVMEFVMGLILTLIFVGLAYALFFTDLGPRTINAVNYYAGTHISTEPFAKYVTAAGFLDAKITAIPGGTVCNFEPVYFSANSSTLPKGLSIANVSCYWDFDFNISNGYEASTCDANYSSNWPLSELQNRNVTLVITEPTGKSDKATAIITSSINCASCVPSKPCSVELTPSLGTEISNGQTINISFNTQAISDIHLVLEPKSGQPQDLKIYVCDNPATGLADYSFIGNLTSPTITYDANLARAVDDCHCEQNPCKVPITFYFKNGGSIKIKEVWIPLSSPV